MPSKPPIFRPAHVRPTVELAREYDQRRGTAHQRGYTFRLRAAMARFKVSQPLCLGCAAVGRVTATEVTDHVIPAQGDIALLWDQGNWQPACRWHHDVIKQMLERLFHQGSIAAAELRLDSKRAIALTKSRDENRLDGPQT